MYWNFFEYTVWVSKGCPVNTEVKELDLQCERPGQCQRLGVLSESIGNLVNLQRLDCSGNGLASLPDSIGNLVNLQHFSCEKNHLTTFPDSIGNLTDLRHLHCEHNKLTTLPDSIGNLTDLQYFHCAQNKLTTFPDSISQLVNLKEFYCTNNHLTTLPDSVGNLANLEYFCCANNQLTTLPDSVGNLVNLQNFSCQNNHLTTLPDSVGNLANLEDFCCANNQITTLPDSISHLVNLARFNFSNNHILTLPPQLARLRNIINFLYYGNPIEYIPPNVRRMIDRHHHHQGLYGDTQSVHNSTIQESVRASITALISFRPRIETIDEVLAHILADDTITDTTKESLVEYSQDTSIHGELGVSFADVLIAVWNRIIVNQHASEIKAVLGQEMTDAACMCFTGRLSRLVNCLNGFDECVVVRISDTEQLGNVVAVVKEQLEARNAYSVDEHKRIATQRLGELGYSPDVIAQWISYIE